MFLYHNTNLLLKMEVNDWNLFPSYEFKRVEEELPVGVFHIPGDGFGPIGPPQKILITTNENQVINFLKHNIPEFASAHNRLFRYWNFSIMFLR